MSKASRGALASGVPTVGTIELHQARYRQQGADKRALAEVARRDLAAPALEDVATQLCERELKPLVSETGVGQHPVIVMPRPGHAAINIAVRLTPTAGGVRVNLSIESGYFTGTRHFAPGFDGLTVEAVCECEAVSSEIDAAFDGDAA